MNDWSRALEEAVMWRREIGLVPALDEGAFIEAREDDEPVLAWAAKHEGDMTALAARALDDCGVYWVAANVCELLAAAIDKPGFREATAGVRPPERNGYVVFQRPPLNPDDELLATHNLLWTIVGGKPFWFDNHRPDWVNGRGDYVDPVLLALWAFLPQRVVVQAEGHLDRPARRRLARVGRAVDDVPRLRVVTLRRAANPKEEGEEVPTLWTHRWLVDGHWRQQWYPAAGEHRTIWIDLYEKGPAHLPLVNKRRVYRTVR